MSAPSLGITALTDTLILGRFFAYAWPLCAKLVRAPTRRGAADVGAPVGIISPLDTPGLSYGSIFLLATPLRRIHGELRRQHTSSES